MAISDPSGFNMLTNLMNSVGSVATNKLNQRKPSGLKAMQGTFGALGNPPEQVLPGGGTVDQGVASQLTREEMPSAELPLYQAQRGEKIGYAGMAGGAANLGSEADVLGQQYRETLQSIIGPLMTRLGIPAQFSTGATGAGGLLAKIISGVP